MSTERRREESERLKQYGIELGAPILIEKINYIGVPRNPHVFYCQDLFLAQQETGHLDSNVRLSNVVIPRRTLTRTDNSKKENTLMFSEVMVMFGHGVVEGKDEENWMFLGTSQTVSKTVEAYEKTASELLWPHLDVVIACNPLEITPIGPNNPRVTFSRRHIPYIYPESTVYMFGATEVSSKLVPHSGSSLIVKAERWNDIDWWVRYWSNNARNQQIPEWAVLPSKYSAF